MKNILLSGISGFIGSHISDHILKNTDWNIVGIASWQHKGVPERLLDSKIYQENKDRVKIITHDLQAPFSELTKKEIGRPDYILNVASESHVDRSITDPVSFIKNNVDLCLNMLEYAREVKPSVYLQFGTDEEFGNAKEGELHKEWSPQRPSNPYSASKAAQSNISYAYWRTYGIPLIMTQTMNCVGEYQDKEKFLPLCIRKILAGETITIHSYPDKKRAGTRFYIHARNVADALLFILKKKPALFGEADNPDRYNIVGEQEIDNLSFALLIGKILGKEVKYEMASWHSERPGHDIRYALDGTKLREMGWEPKVNFENSLEKIINWYLENKKWLE